jgi:hypothetical protein
MGLLFPLWAVQDNIVSPVQVGAGQQKRNNFTMSGELETVIAIFQRFHNVASSGLNL